ncbi:hypothetical protein [Streptomyces durbertensis]|nr:hypothetical protein [Streptomyces durbertensis]
MSRTRRTVDSTVPQRSHWRKARAGGWLRGLGDVPQVVMERR